MKKRRIEAAVFDVDGMILDTREFIYQAYEHSMKAHGLKVPSRKVMAREMRPLLTDTYLALAPKEYNDLLYKTHNDFQSNNLDLIIPYPGLHEMLSKLRAGGVKLGVFSSRQGNLIPLLTLTKIDGYFDIIVDGHMAKKPKPDPEGLMLALRKLGVKPNASAMLGDTKEDIQAGKAADVALTIGITHGIGTRESLEAISPDYIVDNLSAIADLLLGYT